MGWKDAPEIRGAPKWASAPSVGRAPSTGSGVLDQTLSSVNEAVIGAGQGLYNLGAFFTDPITGLLLDDRGKEGVRDQRAKAIDATSRALVSRPSPVARTTGQIASTLPLGSLKLGAKAAQIAPRAVPIINRAVQGALGGAAVRDTDAPAGTNMGVGALANVALPPLVGKAVSYLGTRAPVRWAAGKIAPYASRAVDAIDDVGEAANDGARSLLGVTPPVAATMPRVRVPAKVMVSPRVAGEAAPPGVDLAQVAPDQAPAKPLPRAPRPIAPQLGRAAQARLDNFRKIGVQSPTTGMVTRDPRAWTFERETAKSADAGDVLLNQFKKVNDDLDRAANGIISKQGGRLDPEQVGMDAQKVLDTKRNEMQQVTSALYKSVKDARGEAPAGQLNGFREVLDDPDMLDNPVFDAMRDGVTRRMQRFGMAGESGMLRKDAVANISQAEALRKFVGQLGDGKDPAVRMMRGRMIDALDDDVVEAVGDDAFKAARASAKARFEEFKKTFVGKVADDGIAPERLVSRIMQDGVRAADVRSLRQSFTTGTPEQIERGQKALDDIGARAVTDLFDGSRLADGRLSGAQLGRKFAKAAPKLRVLLRPEQYKQVQRVVAATRDATTDVPFSSVNHSNSASSIANMFSPKAGNAPVGKALVKNIAKQAGKHALAFSVGGLPANVGVAVADGAAASVKATQAAREMARQVEMASSPEAAAAALESMQTRASADAAFRAAIKRWQDRGFYGWFSFGSGK